MYIVHEFNFELAFHIKILKIKRGTVSVINMPDLLYLVDYEIYLIFVYVHLCLLLCFILQYLDDKTRVKEVVKSGKVPFSVIYSHDPHLPCKLPFYNFQSS